MNSALKSIICLTLITFFIVGTASPITAKAAEQINPPVEEHHEVAPVDDIAQNIVDNFGIGPDIILNYQKQGVLIEDLYKAALLAKASKKSLKEVMSNKGKDNTWKDVAIALEVTMEDIKRISQDADMAKLEKLDIPKKVSQPLLKEGYCASDIAIANRLSIDSTKTMDYVLIFKDVYNTWYDVAQILDIPDATFNTDIKNLKLLFHDIHSGVPWEDFQ